MNKKQTKPKMQIKWPTGLFTIAQLQALNGPSMVNITLRFKINQKLESKDLVSIGKNPSKMGRPTLVFAPYPVPHELLMTAMKRGVILNETYEKIASTVSVEVAKVTKSKAKAAVKSLKDLGVTSITVEPLETKDLSPTTVTSK